MLPYFTSGLPDLATMRELIRAAAVRRLTDVPVCVGFGIGNATQVRAVGRIADLKRRTIMIHGVRAERGRAFGHYRVRGPTARPLLGDGPFASVRE